MLNFCHPTKPPYSFDAPHKDLLNDQVSREPCQISTTSTYDRIVIEKTVMNFRMTFWQLLHLL